MTDSLIDEVEETVLSLLQGEALHALERDEFANVVADAFKKHPVGSELWEQQSDAIVKRLWASYQRMLGTEHVKEEATTGKEGLSSRIQAFESVFSVAASNERDLVLDMFYEGHAAHHLMECLEYLLHKNHMKVVPMSTVRRVSLLYCKWRDLLSQDDNDKAITQLCQLWAAATLSKTMLKSEEVELNIRTASSLLYASSTALHTRVFFEIMSWAEEAPHVSEQHIERIISLFESSLKSMSSSMSLHDLLHLILGCRALQSLNHGKDTMQQLLRQVDDIELERACQSWFTSTQCSNMSVSEIIAGSRPSTAFLRGAIRVLSASENEFTMVLDTSASTNKRAGDEPDMDVSPKKSKQ